MGYSVCERPSSHRSRNNNVSKLLINNVQSVGLSTNQKFNPFIHRLSMMKHFMETELELNKHSPMI